jgi:hypothetical protein
LCQRENRVVADSIRADTGGEKKSSIVTEGKSAGKRHDCRWEIILAGCVKWWRKRHDGAPGSRADIITTVRPEISATRVQSFDLARVAHHHPTGTKRQHSIAAAVEKQQPFAPINGETARINDAAVITERAEEFAIAIKTEKRTVSVAIRPCCAGDKERHPSHVPIGCSKSECSGSKGPVRPSSQSI